MKHSSAMLVIVVLGVCCLVGIGARQFLKARRGEWREWVHVTDQDRTLLIEGIPVQVIPSECRLRAQVVGPKGELLHSEEFIGGWRIDVRSGQKSNRTEGGPGLVELHSIPFINGRAITKQYYRIVKDRLVLVRLEDDQGKYVRNNYEAPNHTIGPRIPDRDPSAWEASLTSTDPAEVLWALVWIGGRHADTTPVGSGVRLESPEDARAVQVVRSRESVRKKIAELTKSRNPWIAEAARMVQTAPEEE